MNISLNWLKQYVDLPEDLEPREFALRLTMSTVEVEGVEAMGAYLNSVVVGRIKSLAEHPDADKLRVVQVDLGKESVQIVCGGSNLREGMLVAVALPGAKVRWHGEGDLVELRPAKLRGVESFGMICASNELGLADKFPANDDHEIMDLSALSVAPGTALATALNLHDAIIEIDNKSLTNRPDLWGHYGLAREAAALYGVELKDYPVDKLKDGKEIALKVKVENQIDCPRYLGLVINNVTVGQSPDWLRERLIAIGQKPINNIVDITNYLMFDLGQPLHAFDSTKIKDAKIFVRRAKQGEKMATLDNEERALTADDLVIADAVRPLALAGVMGGADSEIAPETTSIILEAANFEPYLIRKTAARFNLRTESAIRFEKSLDPYLAATAISKAAELVLSVCPEAKIASALIDEKKITMKRPQIKISWKFIKDRIGETIANEKIAKILLDLGFEVKSSKLGLSLIAPTWRSTKDISIKEDIIEEITRIYGYDNLTPVMPASESYYHEPNQLRELEREVKKILTLGAGADEVYDYSFASVAWLKTLGQSIDHVELLNPWDEDARYLRKSLIPGLLKSALANLRFFDEVNIFEAGKTFINDAKGEQISDVGSGRLPTQELFVAGVLAGKNKSEDIFYEAKGVAETVLNKLGLKYEFRTTEPLAPWCHPKRILEIIVRKEIIGLVAVVHPRSAQAAGLPVNTAFWQLNLTQLIESLPVDKKFSPVPKFPSVDMDLSVIVDESVEWKNIHDLVSAVNSSLIKKVTLLDVFKNGKIKEGKKSLTFRISYLAEDRTLAIDEVNKIQEKIREQLGKAMGAEVRQ